MITAIRSMVLSGLLCSPFMLYAQEYFQQQVDHVIEVRLDDEAHVLHAHQEFTYTNNSPVALDSIWIHLWPNAYSRPNTALDEQLLRTGNVKLHFAKDEDRGWIDSLDFRVDGASLKWELHPDHPDIAWILLAAPLAPGSSITITTPFRVKIPHSRYSRLGHTGQAYHITQWYPKPAVFDAEGWHPMPYLTQGEFYSEFGQFDVSITLPENYVVGSTGILQDNPSELAFMETRANAAVHATTNEFPPSAPQTKTVRYIQGNVHDFAWFADKRFIVRKSSVTIPQSGRAVTTWAMFTPKNAELWSDAVTYVNESVRLYSEWVGEYPYDACTAIDGTISAGGGMEYPMITIIGDMGSKRSLDNVIAHEVGHNWFYGILASNERDHPWMDEGINSFVELRYMRERYPEGDLQINVPLLRGLTEHIRDPHRFQSEGMYRINARRNLDQPIELPSDQYTSLNYGAMVYGKSALVFDHLFAYLGAETFDRCMHAYYDQWKFKHPSPADVRTIFERESGKELGWVFEGLIGTDRKFDVKARGLKGTALKFKSTSDVVIPFPITAWRDTVKLGTTWSDGAIGNGSTELPWGDASLICIDHDERTLDIDRRNNQVSAHGIFRRTTLPHFGFLTGIERHDRRSLYWTPLIARNGHDGWHFGIGLHNYQFPSQRTEWIVAPMYALDSESMIGGARIEHHFDRLRSRIFQNIGIALNTRTASTLNTDNLTRRYSKIAPSVQFDLKREPLSRPWQHRIGTRAVYLRHDAVETTSEGNSFGYFTDDIYGELSYSATNNSALLPTAIRPVFTAHENFIRGSIEITQGFTYNRRKDQLRLRAFGGSFLGKVEDAFLDPIEIWQLSWGPQDMLFDDVYLHRGRYDTDTYGRQFVKQQGAFKTPFIARSDTWIGALNMEFDLPIGLPISLFASSGWVPVTQSITMGDQTQISEGIETFHEAGVGIQLMRDVMEVWFPLVVSENIGMEETGAGRGIAERIRFVLVFENFDPTRVLRNVNP